MIYEPVWISTIDHLNQFKAIMNDTATVIKRGGRYNVPSDFPQARIAIFFGITYSSPVPMVLISNGVLDLNDNEMRYKAHPLHVNNGRISNLKDDLEFSLSAQQIISLEHYFFASPINKTFNISFSRVQSDQEGLLRDFLICVGGKGLVFEKMRRDSAALFDALTRMTKLIAG